MRHPTSLLVVLLWAAAGSPALAGDTGVPDCGYPKAERDAHIEGTVTLDITVAVDGSVKNAEVVQSSGNSELDQVAAVCAKAHWHYKPATQNGTPVEARKQAKVVWAIP